MSENNGKRIDLFGHDSATKGAANKLHHISKRKLTKGTADSGDASASTLLVTGSNKDGSAGEDQPA